LAGTGKSTIARTIASEYHEQGRLGASFFFSKGGGDVSHAGKFFTSIAVQLANRSPALKRYICEAIKDHTDIASQSLRDQWRQLVLRPLLNGNCPQSSFIFVVDALDECEGHNDIRVIVELLAEARSLETVRLRVLMTSRPEIPIRHGIHNIPEAEHKDFVLHNISPSIVDHDIFIFLEVNFRMIREEYAFTADWPGEEVIRRLVQNASSLFIWAATACRFIYGGRQLAADRLKDILKGDSSVTAPEMQLNEIYTTVLKNYVGHDYSPQESIVNLFSPLSAHSLARLLNFPKEVVDRKLADLHAILDISTEQSRPIRLHHPSFRDFLIEKNRCGDPHFWVDKTQAHKALADSCIRLMTTTLKRDILGLNSPGALITDIESSRVEECLPPEVQYACLYWVQHLQRSNAQIYDNDQVHQFLLEHLLHWLEAISLMDKTAEGVLAIISLESIVAVSRLLSTKDIPTNLGLRPIKIPLYRRLSMIRSGLPYTIDQ
jgi:NACHT domain